jgi:hypothetical protein
MKAPERQNLIIPFIADSLLSDIQQLGSNIRRMGVMSRINQINWSAFSYQPEVLLYAGYSVTHLWLLYQVKGDFFRAKALTDQEAVWEDNCVEFFCAKEDACEKKPSERAEIVYLNFEFNAIGTALSACGTTTHREFLSHEALGQIARYSTLDPDNLPEEGTAFDWELIVSIPLDLLGIQRGSTFTANFYKCGDLTKMEHYLSWSPIVSGKPNFHLPQYFGKVKLML